MKLKLTKNNTIILTSVILVLSIALGFLVWRVNQKETTAPTESSAMGGGCSAGVQCTGGEPCYWPYVAYCDVNQPQGSYNGTCTCKTWEWQQQNDPDYACWDSAPRCTPSAPPGNYELCCTYNDCDDPACQNGSPNTVEVVCSAKCQSCSNPYVYQTRYKLIEEEPYCGDSNLDSGEECDPPGGSCTKDGKPGVCSSTCTCNLNPYCGDSNLDTGEECDPPGGTCTKDGNPGVCNSSCTCVANPYCGDSKLDEGEECEQGDPTGVECSWSTCNQTACICLPAGLNISKSVVESCIDEGTENPSSQLVYTISVTNTGQGIGSVRQLEDVLDPKVLSSGITPIEITGGGVYSSGKILWSFIPSLDISPGTTEIFSYKLLISKENFGIYNNTVTLTPESGDTIQANATIEADCLVTVPQTGIFDSTLGRISVGFILLLIGGVVYNLPSEIFINKFNKNRFKYRVKFENNIWKKN